MKQQLIILHMHQSLDPKFEPARHLLHLILIKKYEHDIIAEKLIILFRMEFNLLSLNADLENMNVN